MELKIILIFICTLSWIQNIWALEGGKGLSESVLKLKQLEFRLIADSANRISGLEPILPNSTPNSSDPKMIRKFNKERDLYEFQGTDYVFGFLDYGLGDYHEEPSLLALFNKKQLPKPLCVIKNPLEIFDIYGSIQAVELQIWGKSDWLLAIQTEGGDGGETWHKINLVEMNASCQIKYLHQQMAYQRSNNDEQNEEGEANNEESLSTCLSYIFMNPSLVEITETLCDEKDSSHSKEKYPRKQKLDLKKLSQQISWEPSAKKHG